MFLSDCASFGDVTAAEFESYSILLFSTLSTTSSTFDFGSEFNWSNFLIYSLTSALSLAVICICIVIWEVNSDNSPWAFNEECWENCLVGFSRVGLVCEDIEIAVCDICLLVWTLFEFILLCIAACCTVFFGLGTVGMSLWVTPPLLGVVGTQPRCVLNAFWLFGRLDDTKLPLDIILVFDFDEMKDALCLPALFTADCSRLFIFGTLSVFSVIRFVFAGLFYVYDMAACFFSDKASPVRLGVLYVAI